MADLDLIQLIPEHFHNSQILKDYVKDVSSLMTSHRDKVLGLYELVNPNTVPLEYIQYLADLINLEVLLADGTSEIDERKQLINAVDLYKIKGTYLSFVYAGYLFGLSVILKDMYTEDYLNFVPQDWFIGDNTQNPGGLDYTYYKSAHFGIYFILDRERSDVSAESNPGWDDSVYTWDDSIGLWGYSTYLWHPTFIQSFKKFIEFIRPVNTVPHYTAAMYPICDESGSLQTVAGNIKTSVTSDWSYTNKFFDSGEVFDDGSSKFDSSLTAFLSSITHFKLGTGNKNISPISSGFAIETPVITGTITQQNNYPTYNEFIINIPLANIQSGISELGLYKNDTTTLVVGCTFPDIDKNDETDLLITVRVNKV